MIIFSGSSSTKLVSNLLRYTDAEFGRLEVKRFPDNEFYVRIHSSVKGKDCAVIQSIPNHDSLIELLLILDALKDLEAHEIHAVIPYLGYARQDKIFNEGEALSAKTILKLINELCDRITTINCHFLHEDGIFSYHNVTIRNLDAIPILANYFKTILRNPIVIAPDKGALGFAKEASLIMNCNFNNLNKTRVSGETVETRGKNLFVRNKDVLILDDILSTGETLIKAADIIRRQWARSVNVGCIHGVFSKGTDQFKKEFDRLVCTDTIQNEFSVLSVASLIAKELKSR